MKKTTEEVKVEEVVKKPFFFPSEDRTIMAGSLAEAQDILAKEKAAAMETVGE